MQLENLEAREDPYANQVKLLKEEGLITEEQVKKADQKLNKGFASKTSVPEAVFTDEPQKKKDEELLMPFGERRKPLKIIDEANNTEY